MKDLAAATQAAREEGEARQEHFVWEDYLTYVIFTSGSTGRPEGAIIRHRSMVNLAADVDDAAPRRDLGSVADRLC